MVQTETAGVSSSGLLKHIRFRSATALVVANIIGAGIFTTTGFQAEQLGHPGFIFLLWIVGGVLAFCGALAYGELGAAMPEAGGEYVYLRETYGPLFGFMSAFVSLIAGFSAPIASAVKGLIHYVAPFVPAVAWDATPFGLASVGDWTAIGVVWILTAIHLAGARGGFGFNDFITLFKVAGIVMIILAAITIGRGAFGNLTHVAPVYDSVRETGIVGPFAASLVFVMFCYSGWNASAYVASEMNEPQRDLPRSLLVGTGIVLLLYLGLNAVYFYGAPAEELAGKVEVGLVAAERLFGGWGAGLVTFVLSVSLIASASAMVIAGPRVYYALGRDVAPLAILAKTNPRTGAPISALLLQAAVTSLIIVSGSVDQIQQYAGFALVLFGTLAVSCVIVLRIRRPDMQRPFRAWGYPVTPLLFIAVSVWMMYGSLRGDYRFQSLLGLATVAAGGIVFYILKLRNRRD